jgi:hypothetical protein
MKNKENNFDLANIFNPYLKSINELPWLAQKLTGILLVLLGIAGLILPILPGWLFILPGISIIHPPFGEKIGEFEKRNRLAKKVGVIPKLIYKGKFSKLNVVLVPNKE